MIKMIKVLVSRKFLPEDSKNSSISCYRLLSTKAASCPNVKNYGEPGVRQQRKVSEIPREMRIKLQSILGLREIETMKIILIDEKLLTARIDVMDSNKKLCEKNGISIKALIKYPFLLYESNLTEKIEKLKELPLTLSDSIPLARLSLTRLNNVIQSPQCIQRIQDLSKIFDISTEVACDIISRRSFMFSKSLDEIKVLMSLFYAYGFSNEEILKDLWIFKYSESFTRTRLDFIRKGNFKTLKTWMIRCPEEVLYKHIKRETDTRDILGENSVAEYLSKKLCCKESVVKSLILRHPQLENKSLSKMTVMIDLLYRHGYKPEQICQGPKILLHSYRTTELRLKQLTDLGQKPDSLYVLTKSQKKYQQYIENLVKDGTK